MAKSKKKTEKNSRKIPVNAKPEHYFILVTGVPLKNLKELAASLENMNDWVFNHHVNDARNDFSNWTKEILGEHELSEEIKALKNMREMETKILKHLVNKYL
jgi:hypothetical protein